MLTRIINNTTQFVNYDAIQRKTSQTDKAGVTINYQFDMANRLLQRNYPDNLNDVFQYDSVSRLTQAISNRYQNTVTRAYNNDSTIASEGLTTNGENYQISHFFDSAKRNYQTIYPNGKANSRAFTARNQLSSVAYDGNLMANFQYDLGMREVSRGLGNGLTQTTSYRLDNLISQKSVAGITNFSYTYDANKRKTSETDAVNTNLSQTFAYDFENEAMKAKFSWLAQPEGQDHGWSQQNRLTLWASNGTTLNQTQSWSLSLEGAWNSTTVNGNTENRTFNQTYETLFSNSNPMSHDRKGNLTQNKDGSLYTWESKVMDDERSLVLPARRASTGCAQHFDNQMALSTSGTPSVNASYAYDALGRRVSKSSGNTVTIFVNSGYQILTEYASIGNGPFTETQSFVYATYIDDPIALINTNGTYFYHSNQQYSIAAITDSNGNLSERYGYNAYGKPEVITDSILVDNPYFFTGRQLDSETGLFYFRARYYDASLGQFISRDPLNYIDGMNLYRGYFAVNGIDYTGKSCASSITALSNAVYDMSVNNLSSAVNNFRSAWNGSSNPCTCNLVALRRSSLASYACGCLTSLNPAECLAAGSNLENAIKTMHLLLAELSSAGFIPQYILPLDPPRIPPFVPPHFTPDLPPNVFNNKDCSGAGDLL